MGKALGIYSVSSFAATEDSFCAGFSGFIFYVSVIQVMWEEWENVYDHTSKIQKQIIFSVNPFY